MAARHPEEEALTRSDERSARTKVAVAGADASPLGERRAVEVEVEGKPLIVDDYATFPAMGDLDGDGRTDVTSQ